MAPGKQNREQETAPVLFALAGNSISIVGMNNVDAHTEDLARLARRYGVSRLELFGSAAAGDFDIKHSDIDFLVEFEDEGPANKFNKYFGLRNDLIELFERPVDLVT